jgi:hypothetical protein
MDLFDYFEAFIIGQMIMGLALLLILSVLKAPADQLTEALHGAELQLQKLRALTKGHEASLHQTAA